MFFFKTSFIIFEKVKKILILTTAISIDGLNSLDVMRQISERYM